MRPRGFSLLEVMVALSILSVSLVAISGINAGNYASSEYSRGLTVATLLARSKMIDVEEELWKDGQFPEDDKELDGDFEKEGQPTYKWKATARKIDVDIGQLIGSLLGEEVNQENLAEHVQQFIGGLSGASDTAGAAGGAADEAAKSPLAEMLKGDQLGVIFKQVGDNLADAIREIELEITWGDEGGDAESVKFVQYIVTTGRISTPNAGAQLPGETRKPGEQLAPDPQFPNCGNGRVDPNETCDDGNRVAGDGCSPYCQREGGKP